MPKTNSTSFVHPRRIAITPASLDGYNKKYRHHQNTNYYRKYCYHTFETVITAKLQLLWQINK